jgi:hypothetical protein
MVTGDYGYVTGRFYMSSPRFTVQVNVKDGIIVWTAPVAWKFVNQPFANLLHWSGSDVVERINSLS